VIFGKKEPSKTHCNENQRKTEKTSILYIELYIPEKKIVREKDISLRHSPAWHPLPEHPGRAGEPGGCSAIVHFLK
jgi:hypothetical protein